MLSQTENDQELYKALEELGLSSHECHLYVVSLELGPTTIPQLADRLGISRPNIYKVIASLAEKGLAHLPDRKRYARTFVVESPSTVMELIRKKHEQFKTIDQALTARLPGLLQRYEQGSAPTKVQLIQGEREFIKLYTRVFEEANETIQYFGDMASFIRMVSPEFGQLRIQRRLERKVPLQALVLPGYETTGLKTSEKELREIRVLAGADPFLTSFYLFANKAVLWQPQVPMAVLIEDEYFVQMFRSMFSLLWKQAGKMK